MLLQQQLVVLIGIEFEDVTTPRTDPLGGYGYEAEDKFLQPVGRLQPGDVLGVQPNDVAVEVRNNRHDDHERSILRQERAGEFRPTKVVVHHVEEAFAAPTLVVEGDDLFWVCFLVVGHNRPPGVDPSAEQVSLIVASLDTADDQPVGRGPAKRRPDDLGHVHLLPAQPNGCPLLVRNLSNLLVHRGRATCTNIKSVGVRFHNLNGVFLVGG